MLDSLRLSWQLFRRSIRAKHEKSFLGYLWIIIPAGFITLGVWMASHAGVIAPNAAGLPYPLFVFIGTVLWQTFAEGIEVPFRAIEGARSYIIRVMFPRQAIILVQMYESAINAGVRMAAVVILLAIFGRFSLQAAGTITVCLGIALVLSVGIGCLLAPFMLLISDLYNAVKLVLAYGLFLTPALYQPKGDGLFATLVRWNPASSLMNAARAAAETGHFAHISTLVAYSAISTAFLALGLWVIWRSIPVVIERMLLGGR